MAAAVQLAATSRRHLAALAGHTTIMPASSASRTATRRLTSRQQLCSAMATAGMWQLATDCRTHGQRGAPAQML
jgi:hypothetical protein